MKCRALFALPIAFFATAYITAPAKADLTDWEKFCLTTSKDSEDLNACLEQATTDREDGSKAKASNIKNGSKEKTIRRKQ